VTIPRKWCDEWPKTAPAFSLKQRERLQIQREKKLTVLLLRETVIANETAGHLFV
jgi:hypothetical protein